MTPGAGATYDPGVVVLAPGASLVWRGKPEDASFATYGDTVEVFIDSDNRLVEDDESNNRMSRTLKLTFIRRRP